MLWIQTIARKNPFFQSLELKFKVSAVSVIDGNKFYVTILLISLEDSITTNKGVYLGYRVDFGLRISGRFKIGSYICIDFYIILNSF